MVSASNQIESLKNSSRATAPVFVVGCHRSGTNLLYDMLLSAGGFAIYRGYLPVYKTLIPRFGSIKNAGNRRKIVDLWLRSKGFRRSGLKCDSLRAKLLSESRSGGDFMRIVMDEIAGAQNVRRWAVYDPDNVLRIPLVKAELPRAVFVHMIRDGRDIALSLKKMGGFHPLPWDRGSRGLMATAAYWEWMVRRGRDAGRKIPADYIEVHYEELVSEPQKVLAGLGDFLQHDLDYERIQSAGLGRLRESNSSFRAEGGEGNPVNRWRQKLAPNEVLDLESLVGELLEELGYELTTQARFRRTGLREKWMRASYPAYMDTKFWLKTKTAAGRMAQLGELELTDVDIETTSASSAQK